MNEERDSPARAWIGWTLAGLAVLFILVGWVVVRGMGASDTLQQAARTSETLRAAIAEGKEHQYEMLATRLSDQTSSARSLTSDPVWRAAEFVPGVGSGLTALRELAAASDSLAGGTLPHLLAASEQFDLGTFGLDGDTIDLSGYPEARLHLDRAGSAAAAVGERLRGIDPAAVSGPARGAVAEAHAALSDAAATVEGMSAAVRLLPTMVGQHERHSYLLVVHNGSHLRSAGGAVESITRITADSGVLERRSTISARTVPRLSEPLVADLDENLSALLPAGFDTRLSDASSVPDFPTSARLIAAHWEEEHGGSIDGVIAVDVATLARVLAATGPTTVGDYALSGASLVETLTERIPLEAGSRSRQSDHFSRAVRAVLVQAFATEDPGALVAAIAESAADGGIRIWSAHATEQEQFAASDLGGVFPLSDEHGPQVGVLVNDATGGRLDAFTRAEIATAVGSCAGVPLTRVQVTWTNTIEIDEENPPPEGFTGPAREEYEPGSVRTRITVYGPAGAVVHGGTADAMLGARPAVQHEVIVAPGESETVTVDFTGTGTGEGLREVRHTPMLHAPEIATAPLECD